MLSNLFTAKNAENRGGWGQGGGFGCVRGGGVLAGNPPSTTVYASSGCLWRAIDVLDSKMGGWILHATLDIDWRKRLRQGTDAR